MTHTHLFAYTHEDTEKIRLDIFLTERIPGLSRSQVQKLIKAGKVLVNDDQPTVHQFLKEGDKIECAFGKDSNTQGSETTRAAQKKHLPKKLDIVAKTDDYLIINKPPGLLVHPTSSPDTKEITLIDMLLAYDAKLSRIGDDPGRPALVHRLDRDVSGIMIIPRTFEMFEHLKRQFKLRKTEKSYQAFVYGSIEKDEGEIDFVIGRAVHGGKMAARAKGQEGKKALTTYYVLERFRFVTHIEVQIHTGRTHQIRAHLLAIGHPIIGDMLYAPKKKPALDVSRLMLHATYLGFHDLQNTWKTYTVEPPKIFSDFVKKLKS